MTFIIHPANTRVILDCLGEKLARRQKQISHRGTEDTEEYKVRTGRVVFAERPFSQTVTVNALLE